MTTLVDDRQRCDARFQRLLGERLVGVRYFEIEYEEGFSGWSAAAHAGHFLDFGLDLVMADGSVFGLTWGREIVQYGLELTEGSLRGQLGSYREVDVSSEPHWQPRIGRSITEVELFWSWVAPGFGERTYYPQDLMIGFEASSPVYVSVSQYLAESDQLFGMSNEIAVIFSEQSARKYKVGPYAVEA